MIERSERGNERREEQKIERVYSTAVLKRKSLTSLEFAKLKSINNIREYNN